MERYGIDAAELLRRHPATGATSTPKTPASNEEALKHGARILSVYGTDEGAESRRIWIFTEVDRASTALICPEDH